VKDHRTGRKSLAVPNGATSNGQPHLKVLVGEERDPCKTQSAKERVREK
jgi:hypothetical protein